MNKPFTPLATMMEYAGYVTSMAKYRRERRYVLEQLRWHRSHGRTSTYYLTAMLGLRIGRALLTN